MDDGSIKNLVLDGTLTKTAKDGTRKAAATLHQVDRSILYRSTATWLAPSESAGESSTEGLSLSRFWLEIGGFTVPNVSDDRGPIFARRLVFAEALSELNPVAHGSATVNGAPCDILRGTVPDWKPIDVCIDPASGAVRQVVYDPDGSDPNTTLIDDYATILGNKRVVSGWHVAGSDLMRQYSTIVANGPITDADLQPPKPTATWTFGTGTPLPIDVSVDKIMIDATVDGVLGHFLLDTGSSSIALTDQFADEANVKREKSMTFIGVTGTKRGSRAHVRSVGFADGSILHNAPVTTGVVLQAGQDGLLGFSFLAAAIVDIDQDHARMSLYDPATSQVSEQNAISLHVNLNDTAPRIPVKLDGTISSLAMLDTGSGGSEFTTSEVFFNKVQIDKSRTPVFSFTGASGGEEDERCGMISVIDIGPVPYKNPSICFAKWVTPGATVMGFGFLRHFNATFDYPEGKIVLQFRKNS